MVVFCINLLPPCDLEGGGGDMGGVVGAGGIGSGTEIEVERGGGFGGGGRGREVQDCVPHRFHSQNGPF